jgi:uncharacterized protein YneR
MDQYKGQMDLSDGNQARFVLTVGGDGKVVTECGFLRDPTNENIEEFEDAIQVVFEDVFGHRMVKLERSIVDNPEMLKQEKEAFLRGGSTN